MSLLELEMEFHTKVRNHGEGLYYVVIIRDRQLQDTVLTNPPVPYDICVSLLLTHLLTMGSMPV